MSERSIFTGLYWSNNRPHMSFFDGEYNEIDRNIESSNYISIKSTGQKYCTGYYDIDKEQRFPCEGHVNMSDETGQQCRTCRQHDIGSFVAKTGIARSSREEEFLQQNHMVYLALFGRHSTPKVGVARQQRYSDRIHEQGAWAAIDILQTDGNTARALERQISTEMRLPETMSAQRKLMQLDDTLESEVAKTILAQTVEDVQRRFPSLSVKAGQFIFARPDFGIVAQAIDDSVHLIKSIESDFRMDGQIVGLLGKLALIHCADEVYALNTKLLEGYELEITIRKSGPTSGEPYGVSTKKVLIDKQTRLF